ncbi:MAG TPA: cupin domain-containing protein [Longimicrobium sp.]|nr:cupin domain-containing protein [Longimicrobium sp.]
MFIHLSRCVQRACARKHRTRRAATKAPRDPARRAGARGPAGDARGPPTPRSIPEEHTQPDGRAAAGHHDQTEALTVVQARLGYQRPGEEPRFAEAGETVVFKPGEVHKFWNAGQDDLRCTGYVKPADNIEYFLEKIYEAQKKSGRMRPEAFDAAFLALRYRSEFGMAEVPAFVQKFIFPVQVASGRPGADPALNA